MLRIDAHQHFWKFDPVRDSWIDDQMKVIREDFLPADLEPILKANGFDGCVVVQSDQSEQENEFQLAHTKQHDFIKGVVGWVDLQSDKLEERLDYYRQFNKLKGFRHVLQGEPKRDFMLQPSFLKGISLLKKYGYTYDILIFPDQLAYTADFVSRFPDQPFVIDHLAKPDIKGKKIDDWKKDLKKVAQHDNVFFKVSGMVTEADWQSWQPADFKPYLDTVTEAFGIDRLMFGSDWPVCNLAASYEQVVAIPTSYFGMFSNHEQELFFGGNAANFYHL